jgi:ketosteroid isomerase-like protein
VSKENVEVVRRMVELFNSDNPRRAIESFHADVQFTSGFTERMIYRGIDGMREYADDLAAVWGDWHSEDDRFLDASDGRVVWLYRIVGEGKGSGVPVAQAVAIVYTLRDGLISRGDVFHDQHEALKAVGLEE